MDPLDEPRDYASPRKTGGKLVAIVLIGVAVSLTFAIGVRERRCAPLELEFKINSKTHPERHSRWDDGSATAQAPDPSGWLNVTTDGKRYGEGIALRKNRYDFRGQFYSGRGVPLRRGSTIRLSLLDRDGHGAEGIGEIEHTVLLPRSGSATSSNGVFEIVYTCHSDSSSLDFFSNLFSSIKKRMK